MNETVDAVVNATVNATATPIATAGQYLSTVFVPTLLDRLARLFAAPFEHPQMIYIITPLIITLVLMEFYFGRYDKEELGWNTAVGHALVLIFVSVDLIKTIYPDMAPLTLLSKAWFNLTNFSTQSGEAISTLITVAIFALGILLLISDFFHWLPKGLAFFLSGTLQINLIAYLGIVIVYTHNTGVNPMPLDWYTLLAAVLVFIALWIFFGIIHLLEPSYKGKRKDRMRMKANAPSPLSPTTEFTNGKGDL
ncbi:hypothetical protein GOV07_02185 [Candidatus Woesearchaeota archaeon]|nr:hypothetical protein [Candidatus Woesearchaeota archaeon]